MKARGRSGKTAVLILLAALSALSAWAQRLPQAGPAEVGMSAERLALVDGIIREAIVHKDFPGAVLLITRRGSTVWEKAYGESQWVPERKPLDPSMIYDLASLTKPVATGTSIMLLVERGRIRLWDKVKEFVPEFSAFVDADGAVGEDARLWHLLTHTSGLPPYADAEEIARKYGDPCPTETLVRHIALLAKNAAPGERFTYSCLNYITLAHVIKIVSGKTIAEFSAENIFKPLGMNRTGYNPAAPDLALCVPTMVVDGKLLKGIVHDPLARLQGGVSGNAGLFSTAGDLAVFAEMMLNGGEFDGVRVLSPLTVERMTEIFPRADFSGRGLGWDMDSAYSTVRGDLFGSRSYGHSGYTGTSLWLDPETHTSVIFLTNRVHPDDEGAVIALRSKIANIVAASILRK